MKPFAILIDELKNNDLNICAFNCVTNLKTYTNSMIYGNLVERELWTRLCCPILNVAEIYRFNGVLLSTCVKTCMLANTLPNRIEHYYYVWDLEWVGTNNFDLYSGIFTNNNIISRSEEHSKIIESTWGIKTRIIKEMDYEQIKRL